MGNVSAGTVKVVVFGPKFWKKFARQYRRTKPMMGAETAPELPQLPEQVNALNPAPRNNIEFE